jgi:hypothetical protein
MIGSFAQKRTHVVNVLNPRHGIAEAGVPLVRDAVAAQQNAYAASSAKACSSLLAPARGLRIAKASACQVVLAPAQLHNSTASASGQRHSVRLLRLVSFPHFSISINIITQHQRNNKTNESLYYSAPQVSLNVAAYDYLPIAADVPTSFALERD